MIKQLHIAAQYLAAAGISYLEKKDDDSHSNLGWSIQEQELSTWALNEKGDRLILNYTDFALRWASAQGVSNSFPLKGKTHAEALKWIREQATTAGIRKPYAYDFHYELPYPFPKDNNRFDEIDHAEIKQIAQLLDKAQLAFEAILSHPGFESDIRVWPHHFDLGAYLQLEGIDIGFGLAIPDTAVNDFYYYVSGYKGEDSVETKNFDALSLGEWKTADWKAAVLKASGISTDKAVIFLKEAINSFRNQ